MKETTKTSADIHHFWLSPGTNTNNFLDVHHSPSPRAYLGILKKTTTKNILDGGAEPAPTALMVNRSCVSTPGSSMIFKSKMPPNYSIVQSCAKNMYIIQTIQNWTFCGQHLRLM